MKLPYQLNHEEKTIALTRKVVSLLPGNNLEDAPYNFDAEDDVNRELGDLNALQSVAAGCLSVLGRSLFVQVARQARSQSS